MPRNTGLIVVNRLEFMRQAVAAGLTRNPAAGADIQEAFRRYRGFDGVLWPKSPPSLLDLNSGLADFHKLSAVLAYVRELPQHEECDVLLLSPVRDRVIPPPDNCWTPVGIDVGFYESQHTHFSMILNEVLFGAQETLRRFAGLLNTNLLFPSIDSATAGVEEHERLARDGARVEDAAQMRIFALFAPRQRMQTTAGEGS